MLWMHMRYRAAALSVLMLSHAFTARADGDVAGGEKVFRVCQPCHSIDKPRNKLGPHLVGVIGRNAGGVADYNEYSKAMKAAAERGMIWDEATLSTFLSSPGKALPGTSMRFWGLWTDKEIVDVIAYLKSKH